jgi:NAD(P)-dependent dehydrogenase (short-subunit alcohol dehydrogenase family)
MKLKDKVIVITGATSGVGLGTATVAAREGGTVVICGRQAVTVEKTVTLLRETGAKASGIQTDVSDPADLAALLAHADSTWGRVDIWINNAGVGTGTGPLTALTAEDISRTVATNITGTAEACRIVIPYLLKQGRGLLCNTSGRGADGSPQGGAAIYSATKVAVLSLTKSLAEENLGQPISIHAISPGLVMSGLHASRLDASIDPELAAHTREVLARFGTPPEKVGEYFIEVASQEPGRLTGYFYRMSAGKTSQSNMLEGLTPSDRKI